MTGEAGRRAGESPRQELASSAMMDQKPVRRGDAVTSLTPSPFVRRSPARWWTGEAVGRSRTRAPSSDPRCAPAEVGPIAQVERACHRLLHARTVGHLREVHEPLTVGVAAERFACCFDRNGFFPRRRCPSA